MIAQKLKYFLSRLGEMGPLTASWLLTHRLVKQRFIKKNRSRWQLGHSYRTWQELKNYYKIDSFQQIFEQVKKCHVFDNILHDEEFQQLLPPAFKDTEKIVLLADNAASMKITVLGFGTFTLDQDNIPWHQDYTTAAPSPLSWQKAYFSDITIAQESSTNHFIRGSDVKVPWELSRFQHLFHLGLGYAVVSQEKNVEKAKRYADAFTFQIHDWIEKNPFLHGVNWMNPMEVAIRAINLIWAFTFFKNSPYISELFWGKFIGVLLDHSFYLEHTWEVSDKPNNHYLADLVGYLYLGTLFCDIKKIYQTRNRVIQNLASQLNIQIQTDGSSYEGSTAYHRLDTEMVLHALLLCRHSGITLEKSLFNKFLSMKQFLSDCIDQGGNLTQIGDNDSGTITTGIYLEPIKDEKLCVRYYQNFGLTIVRNNTWHLTFRHPSYQSMQPTGHFHEDQLSITLSLHGIPIIIDPGAYVYTSNSLARDRFRSVEYHNTFFIEKFAMPENNLFQLKRTKHNTQGMSDVDETHVKINAYHNYYELLGLQPHRNIELDATKNILDINDCLKLGSQKTNTEKASLAWAFHFAPCIKLDAKNAHEWYVRIDALTIAKLTSTVSMTLDDYVMSKDYGSLQRAQFLKGSARTSRKNQSFRVELVF